MGIFNEFFKKEKPVFTGLKFGFSSGGGGGAAEAGFSAAGASVTAEGITPGNGYRYHVFTSPGDFTVNSGSADVEYMVLAGGGNAGDGHYGGGGAGGLRTNVSGNPRAGATMTIGPGTYPVVVGDGGAENSAWPAGKGSPSSFNSIVSTGGGTGGDVPTGPANKSGGSGGGGNYGGSPRSGGGPGNEGGFPTPQREGFPGGDGGGNGTPGQGYPGGGGGGAGAAGGNGSANTAGTGGNGHPIPAFAAPLIEPQIPAPVRPSWTPEVGPTGIYGGGGGGGGYGAMTNGPAAGGTGGGGDGGDDGGNDGSPGVDYTGGGGGASTSSQPQDSQGGSRLDGAGGKGLVVIRYAV